ncbi:unnamed protein product [Lactuca saligna]|uniref:Uncharacterized protein n=1 Tax=Lactuca saligna TaxID=75948 RepID=A0AA35VLN1_LACSI|nr:unnamed protein product [Lactuca saligna]
MEELIVKLRSNARKPPQAVLFTTNSPSGSDKVDLNSFLVQRKRKHRDPRPRVLITKPVQQPTSIFELAQVNQDDHSPIFDEEFLANEENFAFRSSSSPTSSRAQFCIYQASQATCFLGLYSSIKRKGNIYWLRARR